MAERLPNSSTQQTNPSVVSLEKGKIPPQAIDLEAVELGAMLIDKKGVDEVIDLLTAREFTCYKFRSMIENNDADIQQATKNDKRVTKIGKILRKTSLDELPQFFNVLIGNMSVVGPRPHMIRENERYSKSVDKFMVRHFVKPGITGLAQVKGFRGEIETDEDIINRVKYDIYYLENWSLILDLNIVFLTTINFLTGQKKAY